MNYATYHFITSVMRLLIWGGWKKNARLQGAENLPKRGPGIFIGNHANTLGPIGCVSMLPLRLYPWVRPEMLDLRTNPDYMRADFVEKDLHLKPPISKLFALGLSRLVVPLLNHAGSIPAFQNDHLMELRITVDKSLEHLLKGEFLLVFPEVPTWKLDPRTKMREFSYGVLWLAEVYSHHTGKRLPLYPVCVHPTHRIRLGQPTLLGEEEIATQAQKQACITTLENCIREMYLNMERVGD